MDVPEPEPGPAVILAASIAHIVEYMRYAINGILFHRGVYPAEEFNVEKRFGLDLVLSVNTSVEDYIEIVLQRMRGLILDRSLTQVVVVILDADDGHVMERWVFEPKLMLDDSKASLKSDDQYDREMNAVMKDIMSPTFLPPLETQTVFNVLLYIRPLNLEDPSAAIPDGLLPTHSHAIEEGEHSTMKGLTTTRHTLSVSVAYREEE